jgi:hypothetical protein
MNLRHLALSSAWLVTGVTLSQCGASSNLPTNGPTPPVVSPTPTPSASPTPSSGLPLGMTCDPTPPPILRMHVKVHANDGGRIVLDSKPIVANIDHYCDRWFGNWKFCDTRPEGDPQRVACDYLVTGKAEDTGRWGPTWFYGNDLCAYFPASCANHPTEQFMAIAKAKGTFEACAAETWPEAPDGTRCGTLEMK